MWCHCCSCGSEKYNSNTPNQDPATDRWKHSASCVLDRKINACIVSVVGGKKKPLKAPKKQNKEMDEVSIRLYDCSQPYCHFPSFSILFVVGTYHVNSLFTPTLSVLSSNDKSNRSVLGSVSLQKLFKIPMGLNVFIFIKLEVFVIYLFDTW